MDSTQTNPAPANLQGQRVVIAGGTGSVGEGIVRSYLRAGAHVIIPTRSEEKSQAFINILGDQGKTEQLSFIVGDYTSLDTADATAKNIEEKFGAIHHVVATIGGWWMGRNLWETTGSAWQRHFIDLSTAHLAVARAFIPRIQPGGSYHVIMGLSGLKPTAGSGIVNMQQAALIMMTKVLISETAGSPRVYGQILGPVNNRNRPAERDEWISAEDVGFIAARYAANVSIAPHIIQLPRKHDFDESLAQIATDIEGFNKKVTTTN